ncbi:MAG: protocatechuate 3,4-dioxygenase subunit alpha [Burkholderiales bacterium]
MQRRIPTPEMTVGPFFPVEFSPAEAGDLTLLEGRRAKGEVIEISGRVTQEGGTPLDNLVIEIWQADVNGIYRDPADPRHAEADPDFFGWGRAATDRDGRYRFRTIRPGARDGRAPHVNALILFSGIMRQLHTVIFFEGEPTNESDPVLAAVPPARRALLVAKREAPARYRLEIRLRGAGETPFFDD